MRNAATGKCGAVAAKKKKKKAFCARFDHRIGLCDLRISPLHNCLVRNGGKSETIQSQRFVRNWDWKISRSNVIKSLPSFDATTNSISQNEVSLSLRRTRIQSEGNSYVIRALRWRGGLVNAFNTCSFAWTFRNYRALLLLLRRRDIWINITSVRMGPGVSVRRSYRLLQFLIFEWPENNLFEFEIYSNLLFGFARRWRWF